MAFGDREDELWGALKPRFKPRGVSDPNRAYAGHMLHGTGPFASSRPKSARGVNEARATLARVVRRTPEVLVKVTGRKKGPGHLAAHLDYIGRHGKLVIETRDGERIDTKEDAKRIAEEWSDSVYWRKGTSVSAVAMVFSMPAGTDPETVKQAVRETAELMIGDNHDWLMALHTDTPRPHVHLTVQAQGVDLKRFDPKREDLFRFRENFAVALRSRGVEAEATPRYTRGQGRAGTSMALTQIRRKIIDGALQIRTDADERQVREAVAVAQGKAQQPVFVAKSRARWEDTRQRYAKAADQLERTGDRELARDVRAFVQARPSIETVPDHVLGKVKAKIEAEEASRDAAPREPSRVSPPDARELAQLREMPRPGDRQWILSPTRAHRELEKVLPDARREAAYALRVATYRGASASELEAARSDVAYLDHPKGATYQARLVKELGTRDLYAVMHEKQTPLDRVRELGVAIRSEIRKYDPARVARAMAKIEQQPIEPIKSTPSVVAPSEPPRSPVMAQKVPDKSVAPAQQQLTPEAIVERMTAVYQRELKNVQSRAQRAGVRAEGMYRVYEAKRVEHARGQPQPPTGLLAAFKRPSYEAAWAAWDKTERALRQRSRQLANRVELLKGYLGPVTGRRGHRGNALAQRKIQRTHPNLTKLYKAVMDERLKLKREEERERALQREKERGRDRGR